MYVPRSSRLDLLFPPRSSRRASALPATATGKPRAEFKLSLGTKDRETAKRLLPDFVRKTDLLFDEARAKLAAGTPTEVAPVEPIDGGWLGDFAHEQAEFAARKEADRQRRRAERRHYRDEWRERLDTPRHKCRPATPP